MTDAGYLLGISEFTTNPWPFERDVEAYARLGAGAIEVCEFKLDPARSAEQMRLPGAHGLTVSSVQPAVRTLFPSLSQPEPSDVAARVSRFRQSVERLAPFAAQAAFVTNTGIAPGGDVQRVIDACAREYRALAEHCADHGVRLALEPLNPSIANVETAIWTVAQAMEIIRAVDHPAFGLCLDCWNVWQNADLAREIAACGDRIFVVQVSDWRTPRSFQDRLVPGRGEIPLPAFLRAVRESGFSGAYSVEIFSAGVPDALWEGDLEQALRDCKAGMDQAWAASLS